MVLSRAFRLEVIANESSQITTALHAKCEQLTHEANGTQRVVAVVLRRGHHYAADGRHSFVCASVAA
jgi:hypothetical protein